MHLIMVTGTGLPYKVFFPLSANVPESVLDCLQVWLHGGIPGAEYIPSDFIWWISLGKRRDL